MSRFDLLLKGSRIVDPANGVDEQRDVAIDMGKILCVERGIDSREARQVINLTGKVVIPGVVDSHVHIDVTGHRMMAKVGVITAVDFGARMDNLIASVKEGGAGLNLATITNVRAYQKEPKDTNPKEEEIEEIVDRAIKDGAVGVKITGGHHPFTPEATARMIEVANRKRAYIGFHVGTTATGSNLEGLKEAVDLAGSNRLHIAHVNSYCRGLIKDPVLEAKEALNTLEGKGNIVSESYLAIINGTSGRCSGGLPESHVTRNCLRLGGYELTEDGLHKAIVDGFASVNVEIGGENVLITGEEGLNYWLDAKTDIGLSFPVNVPAATFLCATAKNSQGRFIIDAISTDGGSIPRNVTVEKGLALVRYGGLTLTEFVTKVSLNPARLFGMTTKGHLSVGADADITVLDLDQGKAVVGVALGKIIMIQGVVVGTGGTILTTERGVESIQKSGVHHQMIDLRESKLYA